MYCPKCGSKFDEIKRFCPHCGYEVVKEEKKEEVNEFPKEDNKVKTKKQNNNMIVVGFSFMLVLTLLIVIIYQKNNNEKFVFEDDKKEFCIDNIENKICTSSKMTTKVENFESLNFNDYEFSVTSSKKEFYNSVVEILDNKQELGNTYCNSPDYEKASSNINKKLDLNYSYLCNIDLRYMNNLTNKLDRFYKQNNIKDKIVDSYVVGTPSSTNEYANYSAIIIGSNPTYIAQLRRVHMSIDLFKDYDKLKKSYERDLKEGFHPKNSTAEDIVVHETAHALDYYISSRKYKITALAIEDYEKLIELNKYWQEQSYSKEVVKKAVKIINERYEKEGKASKTELELRKEISGYAAIESNGKPMYVETFAEALVDYLSNENKASDLSKEIYKIVQEDLKKV